MDIMEGEPVRAELDHTGHPEQIQCKDKDIPVNLKMSSVWTPVKQPPHPSEVCILSSDAKKVLEALREAHHLKLQAQLEKLQARTGTSQQHYRDLVTNTQTSQHDSIATGQQHIKEEPHPSQDLPYREEEEEARTQNDNTAVLVTSQRQCLPQLVTKDDEALAEDVSDVRVDTPNDNDENDADGLCLSVVNSESLETLVAERAVKSSSCTSTIYTPTSTIRDVSRQVQNLVGVKNNPSIDQRNKSTDIHGHVANVGQRHGCCRKDERSRQVDEKCDEIAVRDDKNDVNKAKVTSSDARHPFRDGRSSAQVCSVGTKHTDHEHSNVLPQLLEEERLLVVGSSVSRPLCLDQTLNLPCSSAVCKLPSGSQVDGRASKRKSTCASSVSEGSSKTRKVQSSFKTPFRANCTGHLGTHTQLSVKQVLEKGETTAADSPFQNLSEMREEDRCAFHQKLERATEITMTLIYKDRSTQLRELAKNKKTTLDSTTEKIAACISYLPVQPRTGSSGLSEGSSQETEQSYILFSLGNNDNKSKQWSRDVLLSLMESKTRKVCFDAQELMHAIITQDQLDPYSVCCKWQVLDPKVAGWLLDPDNPPITFSDVLNIIKQINPQAIKDTSSTVKSSHAHTQLCNDLRQLSTAMQVLYRQLKEKQLWDLFISVEMKLCPILAAMEVHGIKVNIKILKNYGKQLRDRIDELEVKAHKAAGHVFQVNSHVQLRQVLFEQLKLDQKLQGQKLARTNVQNLKSTSEAVLIKLQDLHPLPKIMLKYRQLMKLNSTYVDGLLEFVSNGYLHTSWEQTSASTGRVQSASPNIQNIPKQPIVVETDTSGDEKDDGSFIIWAREPFVTQEGWSFIAADFQSIELRLLAHMSGDPVLLKVFNNRECLDVFVELASEWLGKAPKDVTTADRERTKRIVYSVIYGVGPEKLAEILAVSKDEAKSFTKSFLNKFKSVNSFSRHCISCQRHNGAARTIFNRLRLVPNINSSNFHARSYAERQTVNFVLQGSAADICKIAMIQVMHELSTKPHLKARLVVQIHDELLLEAPDEYVQEVKEILKSVMEATDKLCGPKVKLKVPLPVSVSVGKTWGHLTS